MSANPAGLLDAGVFALCACMHVCIFVQAHVHSFELWKAVSVLCVCAMYVLISSGDSKDRTVRVFQKTKLQFFAPFVSGQVYHNDATCPSHNIQHLGGAVVPFL